MAGGPKTRKRVEAADGSADAASLLRARDGSAFARCEECKKNVPVALIGMHSCSLDAIIKMNLGFLSTQSQVVERPAEAKKKSSENWKKSSEPKAKKAKNEKKSKKVNDPNLPKRPPTAFFIFMKEFKEANPDSKDVKEEKKPYLDKAAELKAGYDKAVEACHNGNAEDVQEVVAAETVTGELIDEE